MSLLVRPIAYRSPVVAFAPLAREPMAMLLESALPDAAARYSYIAARPRHRIVATPSPWMVSVDGAAMPCDPFAAIAETLAPYRSDDAGPTPFTGGAVGFFAYELGGVLERLPHPKDRPFPADMVVGVYDTIVAFDHAREAAWIIAQGPEAEPSAASLEAALGTRALPPPEPGRGAWIAETSRAEHEARVRATLEAIRAGDIYQANITQRFWATDSAPDPFARYRTLCARSPAPFAAFINAGEGMSIMSASPERFLALDAKGHIETCPIKGTRPRGRTPAEDQALADALRTSAKDRAENLMIVDLLRNDLARVSAPGSVQVSDLCRLVQLPSVHHLVSTVRGKLRLGLDAIDLLRAAFPGGSITGAPKIRAMEIIHALETGARGPYCGAIAWLGFNGAMDSSIVIRTLVQHGDRLSAQAGGGIVADSDPAQEYEETLVKIRPLLSVLDPP